MLPIRLLAVAAPEKIRRWFAQQEVESIRELSDEDLVDLLVAGIKIDDEHVVDVWNSLSEEDQQVYLKQMKEGIIHV